MGSAKAIVFGYRGEVSEGSVELSMLSDSESSGIELSTV